MSIPLDDVIEAVDAEVARAMRLHATPIRSMHEAYGVIKEEFDEFFDEVRADRPGSAAEELVQVAAMCVRAIIDLDLAWKVQVNE